MRMKMAKKLASGIVCAAVALGAEAGTLPAGYAEHEYLESTGTQYIDTGVVITPTMAVEADVHSESSATRTTARPTRTEISGPDI